MSETKDTETKPTHCDCVAKMNEALQRSCPGVKLLTNIATGTPAVAVVRIIGKGSMPILFASFCPFCGIKCAD